MPHSLRQTINNLYLVGIHGSVGDENSRILQPLWLVDSNSLLQQESCEITKTFRNKISAILRIYSQLHCATKAASGEGIFPKCHLTVFTRVFLERAGEGLQVGMEQRYRVYKRRKFGASGRRYISKMPPYMTVWFEMRQRYRVYKRRKFGASGRRYISKMPPYLLPGRNQTGNLPVS